MARGRRKRIAECVYEDACGVAVTVKVGTRQLEERYPLGTSLDFLAARRREMRDRLHDDQDRQTTTAVPGTFASDVETFLKAIAHRTAFKADRSHLKAWLQVLGPLQRKRIRPSHVTKAIQDWQQGKKSARTIRHRVRVLRELYRHFDGKHAPTPTIGLELPRPPAPHPVAVPWKMVQRVAKSLKAGKRHDEGYGADSDKGHARFLLLATTGQRPAQVMRAKPQDVDLKRRLWFVRPAKGGTAIALPLDAAMIDAWKAFIAADAWGPYNSRSFSHLLRRHGWPDGIRPYALRHTLAIDMLLGGADLGDVQGALGHKQIETTRKHYASLQLARMRKALSLKKRARLAS